MTGFDIPDWESVFVPEVSLFESFLRGTIVYFAVLILFRVVLKRQAGGIGLPDIMLVVLVSEAASNALNASAKSIPNAVAAVTALLFWSFALDWASYHWPWLGRRIEPQPLTLIEDGKIQVKNLRDEQITDEELTVQLRQNGVVCVDRVKLATMEPDGCVSVIPKDDPAPNQTMANDEHTSGNFDAAVKHFLQAAAELRRAVEFHDAQAAEHRRAAHEARGLLAQYGIRGRKFLETVPNAAGSHN